MKPWHEIDDPVPWAGLDEGDREDIRKRLVFIGEECRAQEVAWLNPTDDPPRHDQRTQAEIAYGWRLRLRAVRALYELAGGDVSRGTTQSKEEA